MLRLNSHQPKRKYSRSVRVRRMRQQKAAFRDLLYGLLSLLILLMITGGFLNRYEVTIKSKLEKATLVHPVQAKDLLNKTSEPSPVINPTSDPEVIDSVRGNLNCNQRIQKREEIKNYIYTIFGSYDGPTAYAISLAESHDPKASCGEPVYLYAALHHSAREHSVGIFQVNLYNAVHSIHADRIPGNTMEEKEEWLQDPSNCTLYAYWIRTEMQNWTAWSVFTSSRYLAYLK